MNIALQHSRLPHFFAWMILAAGLLGSCRQSTEQAAATIEQETAATIQAAADTVPTRPAPLFFVIPPEKAKQRVWVCDDTASDVFHTKRDCPVLLACRGKGSFRNVSLTRAIDTYGRYNCQTCSKDLDAIFDEDMVREVYGP